MAAPKFTPEPWFSEGGLESGKSGWLSCNPPAGTPLFEMIPITGEPSEVAANARLIKAAPTMYAALRDAQMALADRKTADAKGYTERARKSVDAALAKATGEGG